MHCVVHHVYALYKVCFASTKGRFVAFVYPYLLGCIQLDS